MNSTTLIFTVILLSISSYWYASQKAIKIAGGARKIKSLTALPSQFGMLTAFWCGLPALVFLLAWNSFESSVIESLLLSNLPDSVSLLNQDQLGLYLNDIRILAEEIAQTSINSELVARLPSNAAETNLELQTQYAAASYLHTANSNATWFKTVLVILVSISSVLFLSSRFTIEFKARVKMEKIIAGLLWASSAVALLTTIGIILSVLFESIQFFSAVPPWEFLFGTEWSPQIAMRTDQVAGSGAFGAIPLFTGTLLITLIAMLLSV
ncbi:MAG: phosphate ABC transporter permease family protein, partial [Kangiellaceae bacterium]|nr:phosphate ABC transporter permease family protein [Kangiellaceae bacterium]